MAVVAPAPPVLSGELALFHTTDPLLGNSPVLVFHGPAATIGATSSRIQVHVFTPAGLGSYARLAVSPNSPFYSAVSNLPREEQGDEVCRGLAFGLKKYFAELSETVKKTWCAQAKAPIVAALFGDNHVAVLASRMTKIENVQEVIDSLPQALSQQRLPWVDVDLVLPSGTIKDIPRDSATSADLDERQLLKQRYGSYAELVTAFGESAFLPTSKLKRAPSRANAIGRSLSFLKHQKENARKELSELMDTEESYLERIKELSSLAQSLGADLKQSSRQQVRDVFPDSVAEIVNINTSFLDALRAVFDETEQRALWDIEASAEAHPSAQQARQDFVADTQGIGAVAKCFCDWFPRFADCYSHYMRSHAECAQLLRNLLRGEDTAISGELQDVGEQKLTSLLIEPVQRLPRYSLYIDSITKQLPVRHPALKPLLKARDIISDICTQDDVGNDQGSTAEKLRARVALWPTNSQFTGRLVTAVDAVELGAPFALDSGEQEAVMLLLFTDSIVLLEKRGSIATSARSFLAELESSLPATQASPGRPGTPQDLRFLRRVQLDALQCTESHSGCALQMMTFIRLPHSASPSQESTVDSCCLYRLEGSYEGKATRLLEEMTKARVEGRFSEAEREGSQWEARATNSVTDQLSILSAVFEDSNQEHVKARHDCAAVRVVVDLDKHSNRPRAGQHGIQTVIALSPLRDALCRLSVDSLDGAAGREHVPMTEVGNAVRRKLAALAAAQLSIEHPGLTGKLLARNEDILHALDLQAVTDDEAELRQPPVRGNSQRSNRAKSPVKMLSSFLSSTGPGNQSPALSKKELPPLPLMAHRMLPPQQPVVKPPSREGRPASKEQQVPKSLSSMRSMEMLSSPIKKLEETLSAYTLALQARKGNIVGRSLKMRATADEMMVNDLYNSLLEDPNMMVLAAQATVDVLFAAFEKFVNIAWKEQVGQIVPYPTMLDIQSKAETLFPTDFDEYFKTALSGLAPQNQRAFKGIIKLLADLLDGTGNDGDRGILTAAFAEVLVTEGNPHDFIALIDRFVDDTDTYFGEPLDDFQKAGDEYVNGHKRSRSVNAGSVNSNTSSLRKKFGFGTLSRENSKSEQDSKVASVWRTLSKSTRGDASPASSVSKGTIQRSYSTETDHRGMPKRPTSQDGPAARKASGFDEVGPLVGPASTHNLGLSTIGEHPSFIPTGPPKKKRRSSLSDLKALEVAQKSPPWSPPTARRPPLVQKPSAERSMDKSLPNSPMPSTPSSKSGSGRFSSGRFGSPSRETPRSRLPASFRTENSPGPSKLYGATAEVRNRSNSTITEEVVITARPTSSIPTLAPRMSLSSPNKLPISTPSRSGLSERPGAGNIIKKPSPQPEKPNKSVTTTTSTTAPPQKLRMQSPQKLRERLQNEQSALSAAQNSLQDELSKIGDELTSTPSRGVGSVRAPKTINSRGAMGQPSNMDLAQRVLKVEGQLPKQIEDLTARLNAIQSDLTTSLTVSENKCKKLDELYREANGENEALYTRFNDELGKILKAVRGGEGVEELKKKLKESQEEAAKLKRETSRLKRENVGLRAQLKE